MEWKRSIIFMWKSLLICSIFQCFCQHLICEVFPLHLFTESDKLGDIQRLKVRYNWCINASLLCSGTFHPWLLSQCPRNKDKAHMAPRTPRRQLSQNEEKQLCIYWVVASNWSGIRLGNCTFLLCWVCLDSETKQDYSASSRRPRSEGSLSVMKK